VIESERTKEEEQETTDYSALAAPAHRFKTRKSIHHEGTKDTRRKRGKD
jgi:hypothetical protein